MRHLSHKIDNHIYVAALLGCLALANVIGLTYFGRLDWTRDKSFTLSPATRATLAHLDSPLTIRAYFTADLPPPHASQARYVKDMLDALYEAGSGKIRFEFIDPMAEASAEDTDRKNQLQQDIFGNTVRAPTAVEQQLEAMGIPSVQLRVNQADKIEVKRAYMGMALTYKDRREVLPVVAETQGLEYNLTQLMRKLSRDRSRKLGWVEGHQKQGQSEDMSQARAALSEQYELVPLDLRDEKQNTPEVDGILVVSPQTALSELEQTRLQHLLHAGKSVGFFLPPVHTHLQSLTSETNEHGLGNLLADLGVQLNPGLVLDAECATIGVQQQLGGMRVNQPVRYPFIAQLGELPETPMTRGLTDILFGFSGPLQIKLPEASPIKAQILARSSARSWVAVPPYDLNPMQTWSPSTSELEAKVLMVGLKGPMGLPAENTSSSASAKSADARVVVAQSDSLFVDTFFNKNTAALLLNSIDWLLGDDAMLAMRTRGMAASPLAEIGEARRRSLKYGNIVGLPLGFIGLGLMRWRRREQRRAWAAV